MQKLRNAIRTPDGTVLESKHRHDYREHLDTATGELYFIDGGLAYTRTSVNKVPAEDISTYVGDNYEDTRRIFKWGTYGKDGRQPLKWVPVKDMSSNHIKAVLETQKYIPNWIRSIFRAELEFRGIENG